MPMCVDKHWKDEQYLADKDILITKGMCQVFMVGEGESVPDCRPTIISYTISTRTEQTLKTAYIKLGNVPLGWFSSTPKQGIHIEELPLPQPFSWQQEWPPLEKLVDATRAEIETTLQKEFGIPISQYLR